MKWHPLFGRKNSYYMKGDSSRFSSAGALNEEICSIRHNYKSKLEYGR